MKLEIGLSDNSRQAVADELAKLLADEIILYSKTKTAHWNVEGIDFHEKHLFFETQFVLLDALVDQLAERIRTLGHYTSTSLKQTLELTHLSEATDSVNDSRGFMNELLADHESMIIHFRKNIHLFGEKLKDAGSCDFITGLMEEHEKMAWFLRAHLS